MATTSRSKTRKTTAADEFFSAFPCAFMANLPNMSMSGDTTWWQAYMSGAAEMNKEFMNFVAARLQHDAELGQSLAKCSDWADAASVHEDWVRKMSAAYMGEAETLMEIASSTAQVSWGAATGDESSADKQTAPAGKK